MDGYLIGKWRNDAKRNVRIIIEEFKNLHDDQLNYLSHIHRCSIIEIMTNLAKLNARMLGAIELRRTESTHIKQFRIHNAKMMILKYSGIHRCHKGPKSAYRTDIFGLLEDQQQRLNTLIGQFTEADLKGRACTEMLFRILKINVGETVEYLMYCQSQHIMQARRILMLQ